MKQVNKVSGFSKLSKSAKVEWLIENYFDKPEQALDMLQSYLHPNTKIQKLHDEFIENTISNYYMPFGIAPNFLINGKTYCLPMAIEESSVVAAMAKAANFWHDRGGFKAKVISQTKIGHVHFIWRGQNKQEIFDFFESIKNQFYDRTADITKNMRKRGGGILDVELIDRSELEPNYWQIKGSFNTVDSMGANFINTILEEWANILKERASDSSILHDRELEVIMCILSNYTPDCLVRAEVSCPIDQLYEGGDINAQEFAEKFSRAVHMASIEPYRAVTHNKGIMNGIDALIIATGNDFRAVEACAHAYAAKDGSYTSLTHVDIKDGHFRFWIEIPMSLGTVGGITTLHPMVKFSHELLDHPNANELMEIVAVSGLAQNFSALKSLTTTGIQKGHMKMHLLNVLNQLEATDKEKQTIIRYFINKVPSHCAIVEAFGKIRGGEILN
jgi:hydroxymethylglutaryl-CoA reductase